VSGALSCSQHHFLTSPHKTPLGSTSGEAAFVEISAAKAGRFGHFGRSFPQSSTVGNKSEHLRDGRSEIRRRGSSAINDQNDFAASAIVKILGEIGRATAPNLFVQLRQLSTHGSATIGTKSGNKISERSSESIRRLEEDHGALLSGKGGEVGNPTFARKKPLESEPVGGQPAESKSSENSARPWQNGYPNIRCRGGGDEWKTRIADRGHTGIREHQNIRVASQLNDFGSPSILVVFVQRNQPWPIFDAERSEKSDSRACIFRGNDLNRTQRLNQSARGITQISNRSRGQDDHGLFSQPERRFPYPPLPLLRERRPER
jgi:hypothetical protein